MLLNIFLEKASDKFPKKYFFVSNINVLLWKNW